MIRFWSKVDKRGTETHPFCWIWLASTWKGHGKFWLGDGSMYAHRYSYEALVEPLPPGYELDHLCRNRACVNPAHLEPVPGPVNTLRGDGPTARNLRKLHCPKGHPFNEANTYRPPSGGRYCRACRSERKKACSLSRLGVQLHK